MIIVALCPEHCATQTTETSLHKASDLKRPYERKNQQNGDHKKLLSRKNHKLLVDGKHLLFLSEKMKSGQQSGEL